MTKNFLATQVIENITASQDSPEEKRAKISEILKGIAQGAANATLTMVPGTIDVPKNLLGEYDLVFNRKQQKFL